MGNFFHLILTMLLPFKQSCGVELHLDAAGWYHGDVITPFHCYPSMEGCPWWYWHVLDVWDEDDCSVLIGRQQLHRIDLQTGRDHRSWSKPPNFWWAAEGRPTSLHLSDLHGFELTLQIVPKMVDIERYFHWRSEHKASENWRRCTSGNCRSRRTGHMKAE